MSSAESRSPRVPETHIDSDRALGLSNFPPDASEDDLLILFADSYPTASSVKITTDPSSCQAKGAAIVHFSLAADRDRALAEMNGVLFRSHALSVSELSRPTHTKHLPRKRSSATSSRSSQAGKSVSPSSPALPHPADVDPTNTTLFIGGLSSCVAETQLKDIFSKYGTIIYTKVPKGKGCGFVQFVDRWAAQMAMSQMDGVVIGTSALRISWGRSSSKLAAQVAAAQQTGLTPQTTTQHTGHTGMPMGCWQYPAYGMMPGAGLPWAYTVPNASAPTSYMPYPVTYYMCTDTGAAYVSETCGPTRPRQYASIQPGHSSNWMAGSSQAKPTWQQAPAVCHTHG